jgi:hypothetical protein
LVEGILKVAVKVQKGIKKTGVVFFMWKRIPDISGEKLRRVIGRKHFG